MIKFNFPRKMRTCLLMTTIMLLAGCEYKDLDVIAEPNNYPVRIHFDWSRVDSIPTQMRVGLYPMVDTKSTGSYTWLEVGNRDTTVMAPEGNWRMTAWNRDVTHIVYDHFGWRDSLNVTSTNTFTNFNSRFLTHILDSIFPGDIFKDYPDYMVHDNSDFVSIRSDVANQVIEVCPDSMVITVNVTAHGIKGLEMVKLTRGALTNVAGKRYIAYDNKATEPVTVIFDAKSHPNDSTVTATFWVFGLEPEELQGISHHAALFFWTGRGQTFVDVDVTDIIHDALKDGSEVNIDLFLDIDLRDLLPVNGFDIEIDQWNDELKPIGF